MLCDYSTVSFFDLDKTLLDGDSDYYWMDYLLRLNIAGHKQEMELRRLILQYKEGFDVDKEIVEATLKPLSGYSLSSVQSLLNQFMLEVGRYLPKQYAEDLIFHHKSQGHATVIITATNSLVAREFGKHFSVTDILASESEIVDLTITGNLIGNVCHKKQKSVRLQQWIERQELESANTYYYGDSHNDKYAMETVSFPVATDPNSKLIDIAEKNGWPVLSLRNKESFESYCQLNK